MEVVVGWGRELSPRCVQVPEVCGGQVLCTHTAKPSWTPDHTAVQDTPPRFAALSPQMYYILLQKKPTCFLCNLSQGFVNTPSPQTKQKLAASVCIQEEFPNIGKKKCQVRKWALLTWFQQLRSIWNGLLYIYYTFSLLPIDQKQ